MDSYDTGHLGHQRFRQWLVANPLSEPMLTCQLFQWIFVWNSRVFIQGNAYENVIWKISAILFRLQRDLIYLRLRMEIRFVCTKPSVSSSEVLVQLLGLIWGIIIAPVLCVNYWANDQHIIVASMSCGNMGYSSETHLILKSREISLVHVMWISCRIVF